LALKRGGSWQAGQRFFGEKRLPGAFLLNTGAFQFYSLFLEKSKISRKKEIP
jgi:hypothetical protein